MPLLTDDVSRGRSEAVEDDDDDADEYEEAEVDDEGSLHARA